MGREGRYGKEEVMQLKLFLATAAKTRQGPDSEAEGSVLPSATHAGAKAGDRRSEASPALEHLSATSEAAMPMVD
jgi:hypothetical protein